MTRKLLASTLAIALTATLAAPIAQAEPTNEAVIARQAAMKTIGGQLRILTGMTKAPDTFDVAAAQAALATVEEEAALLPSLFEPEETDPESDAKPEIWTNWDDFIMKASALEGVAATPVESVEDLGAVMGKLGEACKACHMNYKL